ncbi:hypothetical protein SAMN02746065_11441 [Desulfocicer vacuolatum DSM 3385]|uniref:Uncharacterized protein n=1 Tax=Desulfocicer vacuolatum DSM 3385 TaxID=1121400 RepID=A0A1W2CXZ5_9BACT|nr:hypothetical protein SAMN02746065_11441 [Desulfocicer vacuolatum DSM 3385]
MELSKIMLELDGPIFGKIDFYLENIGVLVNYLIFGGEI